MILHDFFHWKENFVHSLCIFIFFSFWQNKKRIRWFFSGDEFFSLFSSFFSFHKRLQQKSTNIVWYITHSFVFWLHRRKNMLKWKREKENSKMSQRFWISKRQNVKVLGECSGAFYPIRWNQKNIFKNRIRIKGVLHVLPRGTSFVLLRGG